MVVSTAMPRSRRGSTASPCSSLRATWAECHSRLHTTAPAMVRDLVAHVANVIDSAGVVVVLLRENEASVPAFMLATSSTAPPTDGAVVITNSSPLLATSGARLATMMITHRTPLPAIPW